MRWNEVDMMRWNEVDIDMWNEVGMMRRNEVDMKRWNEVDMMRWNEVDMKRWNEVDMKRWNEVDITFEDVLPWHLNVTKNSFCNSRLTRRLFTLKKGSLRLKLKWLMSLVRTLSLKKM